LLPLLCHKEAIPIEQQVLLAYFVQKALEEETVSQFTLSGPALIKELVSFIQNEFDESSNSLDLTGTIDLDEPQNNEAENETRNGLLEKIRLHCFSYDEDKQGIEFLKSEVTRALRMFTLHEKMKGNFKEFKDDYFV